MFSAPQICAAALLAAALVQGAPANAGETYYKWIDANGRPVHSDRPPPKGVDYEVIRTGSGLRRQVDSEEGAVPRSVEPTESNKFEPVEMTKVKVEKNPEYCARAQENLETLNTQARIRMRNDEGEIVYLSEEEKEAQRERARDTIEVHCE